MENANVLKISLKEQYEAFIWNINKDSYIISDTHFEHYNLILYENIRKIYEIRNKKSIDLIMQENWNSIVKKDDIVFHLGDFAWRNLKQWSESLNGYKIMLKGNHDHGKFSKYIKNGWNLIVDMVIALDDDLEIIELPSPMPYKMICNCLIKEIAGVRILFSHLPVYDDNFYDMKFNESRKRLQEVFKKHKCEINIHGHIHSKTANCEVCYNVSVEKTGFRPIKIKDFLKKNNII
ncbi:MAG: metallophosphoesterase [Promethearchaeota archaeon]